MKVFAAESRKRLSAVISESLFISRSRQLRRFSVRVFLDTRIFDVASENWFKDSLILDARHSVNLRQNVRETFRFLWKNSMAKREKPGFRCI